MKDSLIKGLAGAVIGGVIFKTIKDVRARRLDKEMYESVEVEEDEHSSKE